MKSADRKTPVRFGSTCSVGFLIPVSDLQFLTPTPNSTRLGTFDVWVDDLQLPLLQAMKCVPEAASLKTNSKERTPFKEGRRVDFTSPCGWLCAEDVSWRAEGEESLRKVAS